ncbi:MAG: molybdopterin molybdotransferase MoeA [Sphingobacteriaceae bacterium]|nr:molybdopterin molybdotransferase MoeA [Sphingobacteriaceae bacterium]
MISYKEAQDILLAVAQPFGTEIIDINDAYGRVLAEDIFTDRDYPPFNRSAMDGYAINFKDWQNGHREFDVQEVIYAGATSKSELKTGAAFKIMTGAAVPFPANTVIRREDSLETSNKVSFCIENLKEYQNIAKKGEDLQKDSLAIKSPTICSPTVISTLATLGKSKIKVAATPKIALFTTGNEVKPLDWEVSEVEIRNSNYFLLKSLLKSNGLQPYLHKHLPDDVSTLKREIENALNADIIIMSGGVSAGDADYVPEVLESLGVKKLFHKAAIKPGKPIWCGKAEDGPMVFALPGNPFSSFVTFKIFIEGFLYKCSGLQPPPLFKTNLNGQKVKKTSFDEFFPVKFVNSGTKAEATRLNGSGDIRLGIDADALAIHPSDIDTINDGDLISYFKI